MSSRGRCREDLKYPRDEREALPGNSSQMASGHCVMPGDGDPQGRYERNGAPGGLGLGIGWATEDRGHRPIDGACLPEGGALGERLGEGAALGCAESAQRQGRENVAGSRGSGENGGGHRGFKWGALRGPPATPAPHPDPGAPGCSALRSPGCCAGPCISCKRGSRRAHTPSRMAAAAGSAARTAPPPGGSASCGRAP